MEVLKSEQNIINLNDHIKYDISIKHVDLSKNNIAYIPDEFGNLLNLKVFIIIQSNSLKMRSVLIFSLSSVFPEIIQHLASPKNKTVDILELRVVF